MIDKNRIPRALCPLLEAKFRGRDDEINFPPPVFDMMKGEVVDFDAKKESFSNRFPILDEHLNP